MEGSEEKYTVGMFKFIGKTLEIPEELIDEENPLKYKPINNFKFLEYCSENSIARGAIKAFCGIWLLGFFFEYLNKIHWLIMYMVI